MFSWGRDCYASFLNAPVPEDQDVTHGKATKYNQHWSGTLICDDTDCASGSLTNRLKPQARESPVKEGSQGHVK